MRNFLFIALVLGFLSCSRKPDTSQNERHYSLSGKITALNRKSQTATVDGEAIPNFMEAMTMDYPIKVKAEFDKLRVGEYIKATVNVSDSGDYNLSNVREEAAGQKE